MTAPLDLPAPVEGVALNDLRDANEAWGPESEKVAATTEKAAPAPSPRESQPQLEAGFGTNNAPTTEDREGQESPPRVYITGWRLYALTFGLSLSLFLSSLETTIVSTSLVSITNALGGFDQRNWVVTSYLITYTGFMIIFAKFSDIFGRKFIMLLALAFFTIFSIVCGSVSSILALIIARAFQGVGASGIYAMVTIINPEMVPPGQWGRFIAIISLVNVLASVLGPILGGAINDGSNWRWVFLLNAPAGAVATAVIAFLLPTHFPHQGDPSAQTTFRQKFSKGSLARLDVLGAFFLLASCILVVFGCEEAGPRFPWSSPLIISTITIGGFLFLLFIGWERIIGRAGSVQEPVFPLRLMKSRIFVGLTLVGFLTGVPFMTVLVNLPQRFQAVNGDSAWSAGIHTLPLLLSSPVGTIIAGHLASKMHVPPFYILMSGVSLQLLGVGLASSVRPGDDRLMYGFEVLMGTSFGMTLVVLLIFVPFTITRADLAVAIGAITQIRVLGGTIGLAISATLLNNHISANLPSLLDESQIAQISDSVEAITQLPESLQIQVRHAFADGYGSQMRIMMYFSVVVWLCALLTWERKPRTTKDLQGY